jgi:hypothetical protein
MDLWHVSEESDIALFEPRLPSSDSGVTSPVVWAVADSHLVNYLFPRECPRVSIRQNGNSEGVDIERLLGRSPSGVVLFIETAWLSKVESAVLWLYRLPTDSFESVDSNAGYLVSARPVSPVEVRRVDAPLRELMARGAELRVVPRLRAIAEEVALSTLSFSIIRLRNAI